jgi:hypothetical protein
VARHYREPLAALRAARNGRALIDKGRGAEVEWCARISQHSIVGHMPSAAIRILTP